MAFLTHTDLTRNIDRFYVVAITPTLFGEWAVLREWGRRGSPGTLRLDSYRRREEAHADEQRTIKRRLQRGYAIDGVQRKPLCPQLQRSAAAQFRG